MLKDITKIYVLIAQEEHTTGHTVNCEVFIPLILISLLLNEHIQLCYFTCTLNCTVKLVSHLPVQFSGHSNQYTAAFCITTDGGAVLRANQELQSHSWSRTSKLDHSHFYKQSRSSRALACSLQKQNDDPFRISHTVTRILFTTYEKFC